MDVNSLAHTKWECKYHIVFAPKYRRQIIYKAIRADVGEILGSLCRRKGIEIIEAECCPDHIHMLVRIPPKYSVSEIVGYLKGKSSLMIFERHANLKYKYGNRHFWCRGYYVDTVGKNTAKIKTCCMRFSLLGKKKTACLRQTVCPQRRECLKSLPRLTKSHAFKREILLKIFAANYCGESRKNAEERAYFIVFSAKRQYIVLLYAAWHNPGNVLQ